MYAEAFPSKLKFARQRTGFTQMEVAREIGLPQSTLAKYETGKLEPSIETLGKLADFYGISLDWLIGTKGENNLYTPSKAREKVVEQMTDIKKR